MATSAGRASELSTGERAVTRWPSRTVRWLLRLLGPLPGVVSANLVLVLTAIIGGAVVVGLTAAGAEVYDAVAEGDGVAGLDRPVLNEALSVRTAASARYVTWFTHLGGTIGMTIIASAITIFLVLRWRSRTPLLVMLIAVAGSLTTTYVGKAVVGRPRPPFSDAVPPYEHAFSFPSGHTLNSTVIAGVVAYLVWGHLSSRIGRVLAVGGAVSWALAMGASRVFLGHHWLTDVIFGWLIGLAWVATVVTAHQMFLVARRSEVRRSSDRHRRGAVRQQHQG